MTLDTSQVNLYCYQYRACLNVIRCCEYTKRRTLYKEREGMVQKSKFTCDVYCLSEGLNVFSQQEQDKTIKGVTDRYWLCIEDPFGKRYLFLYSFEMFSNAFNPL
jgi:hypothetical protein